MAQNDMYGNNYWGRAGGVVGRAADNAANNGYGGEAGMDPNPTPGQNPFGGWMGQYGNGYLAGNPGSGGGWNENQPGSNLSGFDPFGGSLGGQWGQNSSTLWNLLMGRATQGLDVNAKDPVIANQVNNYRAEQQRGVHNTLAQIAEGSGPYKNMQGETRMANEQANRNTGTLQAQLMQNELNARRSEIMNSLGLMGGLSGNMMGLGLQRELGMYGMGLNAENQANYWDAIRSGLLG